MLSLRKVIYKGKYKSVYLQINYLMLLLANHMELSIYKLCP